MMAHSLQESIPPGEAGAAGPRLGAFGAHVDGPGQLLEITLQTDVWGYAERRCDRRAGGLSTQIGKAFEWVSC